MRPSQAAADAIRPGAAHHRYRSLMAAVTLSAALLGALTAPQETAPDYVIGWSELKSTVVAESFVGRPVVVPGDRSARTLRIRNDGPTGATLKVSVVGVALKGQLTPEGARFYDDLLLHWTTAKGAGSMSFAALHSARTTLVSEVPVARGSTAELTLGYALPLSSTSRSTGGDDTPQASFDILLELGGTANAPQALPRGSDVPRLDGGTPDDDVRSPADEDDDADPGADGPGPGDSTVEPGQDAVVPDATALPTTGAGEPGPGLGAGVESDDWAAAGDDDKAADEAAEAEDGVWPTLARLARIDKLPWAKWFRFGEEEWELATTTRWAALLAIVLGTALIGRRRLQARWLADRPGGTADDGESNT